MQQSMWIWLVLAMFVLLPSTAYLPFAIREHRLSTGRPKSWTSAGPLVQRRQILRQGVVPAMGALLAAVLCNIASSIFVTVSSDVSTWTALVTGFPWLVGGLGVILLSWTWWMLMPNTEDPLSFVYHFGALLELIHESHPDAPHDTAQLRERFDSLEKEADAPDPKASWRNLRAARRAATGDELASPAGLRRLRDKSRWAMALAPIRVEHVELRPRFGVLMPRHDGQPVATIAPGAAWRWGLSHRRLVTTAGITAAAALAVGWAMIALDLTNGRDALQAPLGGLVVWSVSLGLVCVCAALTVRLDLLWFSRSATAEEVCRGEAREALDRRAARECQRREREGVWQATPRADVLVRIGPFVLARERKPSG